MEQWKVVKDFKNYEVSDEGKIRNISTGRILKPKLNRGGYNIVDLYIKGRAVTKRIHRLVAEAFIPNPDNKSDVNHINENKTDNRVKNLNWMTRTENINHGTRNKCSAISQSKPIIVIYHDNTYEEYPSAKIASEELGLWQTHITAVLKGRLKTTGGLKFEYKGEN